MYFYLLYDVCTWFMALPEPNNAQAGLVSVVVGAGAAWFGLYVNSTSTDHNAKVDIAAATGSMPTVQEPVGPTRTTTITETIDDDLPPPRRRM